MWIMGLYNQRIEPWVTDRNILIFIWDFTETAAYNSLLGHTYGQTWQLSALSLLPLVNNISALSYWSDQDLQTRHAPTLTLAVKTIFLWPRTRSMTAISTFNNFPIRGPPTIPTVIWKEPYSNSSCDEKLNYCNLLDRMFNLHHLIYLYFLGTRTNNVASFGPYIIVIN